MYWSRKPEAGSHKLEVSDLFFRLQTSVLGLRTNELRKY